MSTGSETQPTEEPFLVQQKEMMQQLIDDQSEYDDTFRQQHAETIEKLKSAHDTILGSIKGTNNISPEIQKIVGILQQNPILVPLVQQFIDQKIQAVAKAVAEALKQ